MGANLQLNRLVVLGLILCSCSRQHVRNSESTPEKQCLLSQIAGTYNSGFSRSPRKVLGLMSDSTFQFLMSSDVDKGEENKGRYKISKCVIELDSDPFNGQESYSCNFE